VIARTPAKPFVPSQFCSAGYSASRKFSTRRNAV